MQTAHTSQNSQTSLAKPVKMLLELAKQHTSTISYTFSSDPKRIYQLWQCRIPTIGEGPQTRALHFINEHGAAFGIKEHHTLVPVSLQALEHQWYIRFQQYINAIPVMGGSLDFMMNRYGEITRIDNQLVQNPLPATKQHAVPTKSSIVELLPQCSTPTKPSPIIWKQSMHNGLFAWYVSCKRSQQLLPNYFIISQNPNKIIARGNSKTPLKPLMPRQRERNAL